MLAVRSRIFQFGLMLAAALPVSMSPAASQGYTPEQQQACSGDAEPTGYPEVKKIAEGNEQAEHGEMHEAGSAKGAGDSERLRNAVETDLTVVLKVLARVQDVETANPEHHGSCENENAGIEAAPNGDPGRGRS